MLTLIKIVFIVVAGIFLVSYLQDSDFSLGVDSSSPSDGLSDRETYISSYDTNNDGSISDGEYKRGELERIEEELADLRRELVEELEERTPSPYADEVDLRESNARERNVDEEYLTIDTYFGNKDRISITGWKLKSLATGKVVIIPKGISPNSSSRSGRDARNISLKQGESAVIVSGEYMSRERFEDRADTFVEGDWMIFLQSNRELWRNSSDAILLLDANDKLVDSVTY